jgi:glycosyltransferase involved in cell wall biosynthesis
LSSRAAFRMPAGRRWLHALHSYMPESRGGIETYVESLVAGQQGRGQAPLVLCASNQVPASVVEGPSAGVLRLPFQDPSAQALSGTVEAQKQRLMSLLRELQIELVHVHHWHGIGPVLVVAARALGIPAIVTLHDYFTTCPLFFRRRWGRICEPDQPIDACWRCLGEQLQTPAEALERPLEWRNSAYLRELKQAAAILTLSNDQTAMLERLPGITGLALECLGLPGRHLHWPRHQRAPWSPPQPLRIATWGGLVEGKGLHTLLSAARQLPPGALEIHHHGPLIEADYRRQLEAQRGEVPLWFHGPFEPAELAGFGAAYDLAVHPSLFLETYGFNTDEALGLGLPVIVPDRGAPRERIGTQGQTFRFGDAGDLARLLSQVLAEPQLLARWRQGSPRGLQDLETHLDRLEAVYARVLHR